MSAKGKHRDRGDLRLRRGRGRVAARAHRLQREEEIPRGLEAILRPLGQAASHQAVEGRRERSPRRRGRRIVAQDGRLRLGRRVPLEGALAGQQLVHQHAQGKDVRAMVGGQAAHLLGGHVSRRAEDGPRGGVIPGRGRAQRRGVRRLREPRQAEVQDLDLAVARHEHVVRLQVAVRDPLVVGGREAAGDLAGVVDGLARGQISRLFAQRLALEELEDDEGRALGADVVDGKDVRVVQRRRRPGLGLEALQARGVPGHARPAAP